MGYGLKRCNGNTASKLLRRAGGALACLLLVSCRQPVVSEAVVSASPGCVTEFDPGVDYFPDKVQPEHAAGFTVDYFNHYKVVTVTQPWPGADEVFEYVLVQCGTPTPPGFESAQVMTVPVQTVATLSTTYLPHLVMLDRVEGLVGMDNFSFVYAPEVRERIDGGELIEFGSGSTLDVERLLVSNPDLVLAYGIGDGDSYGSMVKAGLPVVLLGDYGETSPLGRAEWLLFTALFFNQEGQAQPIFDGIEAAYGSLVQMTAPLSDRPTVFAGFSYEGTWYMSGGNSYAAQLLKDAGADYLWAENEAAVTIPLDFESVFDRAADADMWVNVSQDWGSYGDAIATDPRYGKFDAFQRRTIFNNNARMGDFGGNDYWESGVVNPHLILADLVKIFHPEQLPDHELIYYQPLEP